MDLETDALEAAMLTALFVTTVVGALALHYVFVQMPREEEASAASPVPTGISLAESMEDLPGGVFLQSTFTWTRLRENGEIFLGVHPLLLSLIGPTHQVDLQADESRMEKGDPLIRLQHAGKEIQLPSPIAGRIVEVNDTFTPQAGWGGSARRQGSWVYRIRPEGTSGELSAWLLGEQASAWVHQQYRDIRDFLFQTVNHDEVGMAAADGGELPAGILSELNPTIWEAFQDRFIPLPDQESER